MKNPVNRFKAKLKAGEQQIGLWGCLGGLTAPELLAGIGFDWVVLDTEHSAVDVLDMLPALQAFAAYPDSSPVVRPVVNDAALIKRYLDLGAQTLLIPFVQSRAEAEAAVAAMRYPPNGIRGVAGLTRASRFGQVEKYATTNEEELCLIVQVETAEALAQLEEIATVPGVDGVFFGPSDLSASLGLAGQPGHPDVVGAITDAVGKLGKLGIPTGTLTLNEDIARRCIEAGTSFTAVGVDLAVLANASRALLGRFRA